MVSNSGSPGPAAMKTIEPSMAFLRGGVGETSTPSGATDFGAVFFPAVASLTVGLFGVVTWAASFVGDELVLAVLDVGVVGVGDFACGLTRCPPG